MTDYITTREYADMRGLPLETVRTWTKQKKIPFIKVGNSIMIDRNEPIPAKRKTGRKSKAQQSKVVSPRYKIEITRAYYVAVCDNTGKEVASDFTFMTKADAERIGKRMKSEVEARG